jgi:hypothetical protein
VRVPTRLTLYLESLHGLIAQESIFDGTTHHMVNARMSVGRWRALKEDESGTAFAFRNASMEKVFTLPLLQNLLIDITEIQLIMLCKFLAHIALYLIPCLIWGAKIAKNNITTKFYLGFSLFRLKVILKAFSLILKYNCIRILFI